MRTIPEVCEDIKSILNNIEWTDNCDGETLVDIDELVNEILIISTYKSMKQTNVDRFWKNDRYLFSAKREDNGMWAEGYLIYDDRDHLYRIVIDVDYSTGTHIHTESAPRIDNHTICQCTGLNDKSGKLIWENDIIKTPVGNAKIVWSCSPSPIDNHINVGFEVVFLDATANDNYRHDLGYWIGKSEVIGNIFDNPELLEVGE